MLTRDELHRLTDRQREILGQLGALFRDGFAHLTMSEIASELNCSLRTLYGLAPSRDELVLTVVDTHLWHVGREAMAAISPDLAPLDAVRTYLGAATLAVNGTTAAYARDLAAMPAARRRNGDHADYVVAVTRTLLDLAVEQGDIAAVDTAAVARTLANLGHDFIQPEVMATLALVAQGRRRRGRRHHPARPPAAPIPERKAEPDGRLRGASRSARRAGGARRGGRRPDRRAVRAAHAQPPVDGGRPARPPDLLRPQRRARHRRSAGVHPVTVHALLEAAAGGDEAVDAFEMDEWRYLPPAELLAAWRANRAAAGRQLGHARQRHPDRLVRPVDGREVVPHGPAHGDVGPRPGHRRRRRTACRPPTDRLRHIAQLGLRHPGVVATSTGAWSRPTGDVGVAPHRPVRATSGPGATTTRTPSPARPRTSAWWSPSAATSTTRRSWSPVIGAQDWLLRAQAFAGPATDGPTPKDT